MREKQPEKPPLFHAGALDGRLAEKVSISGSSVYLEKQCLYEGIETIGLRDDADLPWSCHVQLELGQVVPLTQPLHSNVIRPHHHVGHPCVGSNLCLVDG